MRPFYRLLFYCIPSAQYEGHIRQICSRLFAELKKDQPQRCFYLLQVRDVSYHGDPIKIIGLPPVPNRSVVDLTLLCLGQIFFIGNFFLLKLFP